MPTTTPSENSPSVGTRPPRAFGEWYLVVPAMPSETVDGKIVLTEQTLAATKQWFGLVVSSGPEVVNLDNCGVHFNRSACFENVAMVDERGVPVETAQKLLAVPKAAVLAAWPVQPEHVDALLLPTRTIRDEEMEREMQRRQDLR